VARFSTLPRPGLGAQELRRPIRLPGVETDVEVIIRPISALERMDAMRFAIDRARAKGATDPKAGQDLYDEAFFAAVIAASILDAESPSTARQPFFDGGPEAVLKGLTPETTSYLFQIQQAHQEACAPTYAAPSVEALTAAIRRTAEKDGALFFSGCSPSTQVILATFMAGLLASSPSTKWPGGSPSSSSTATLPSESRPKRKSAHGKPKRASSEAGSP
jgi:hypothetical protein